MSCLSETSSTHTCGSFGPTLLVQYGKQPFHQPHSPQLQHWNSLWNSQDRGRSSVINRNISNPCAYSCTAPCLTHSSYIRKGRWFVICAADESLHLFPSSQWLLSVSSHSPVRPTDWRITHYKQSSIMSPATGWFYLWPTSTAVLSCSISLPTCLHTGELYSYCFELSSLTLLTQSKPLHYREKFQYMVILPFETSSLAYKL